MATPGSSMPNQAEVDQILRELGVPVLSRPPAIPPDADPEDPAVIAALSQLRKAEKDRKPVTQFIATPGDRLEQLYDEYDQLKPQLDALETRVGELKDAIKATLHHLDPRATKVQLYRLGRSDGLALAAEEKTYVNSDVLKSQFPAAYAAAVYKKPQWGLRWVGSRSRGQG
jgi:hypothetical protein